MNPFQPLPSDKVAALKLASDVELTLKVQRLPCVFVVGVPSTQEFVRLAGGMENEGTCRRFRVEVNELLNRHHPAPGCSMPPLMAMDMAQFHASTAQKLREKIHAEGAAALVPFPPTRRAASDVGQRARRARGVASRLTMDIECPDCAQLVALEQTKTVGPFLECPRCGVGAPATSWLALAVDRANTRRTELVLSLERCRSAMEHHEETSAQHGYREMHCCLYDRAAEASRVLAKHRGCPTTEAYWNLVRTFKA